MLSVIIPSRNDPYLNPTIQGLLDNSETEIEILVNIDDEWPERIQDKRIKYFHPPTPMGMRHGINTGLENARGEYIMKTDGHCIFAKGFDKALIDNMQDDWLVIPRRYSLHLDNWDRDLRMPLKDYHYLSYPQPNQRYGVSIFPIEWKQRSKDRNAPEFDIDDTMTLQGSCYFAKRDYFMKRVGFLNDSPDAYTQFSGEPLEVGLKYWLCGGEVKVNKKTWYAHLFKNRNYYLQGRISERKFKIDIKTKGGHEWACKHWMNNEEPNMIHPFNWLVEKFWPVPGWPEDRSLWKI